jgi:thiol-disulfide isomerase/thioredoxin
MTLPALALGLSVLIAAPAAPRVLPASEATSLVSIAGSGKPVVLHFWATWCDACREEFPRIRKTLAALPGKGIAVLLVSIDKPEDLPRVKKDLRRFKVEALPSVVLDAPEPDPVATAIGNPAWDGTLPSTFVFDATGKLRVSFIGRTSPSALNGAAQAIVQQ